MTHGDPPCSMRCRGCREQWFNSTSHPINHVSLTVPQPHRDSDSMAHYSRNISGSGRRSATHHFNWGSHACSGIPIRNCQRPGVAPPASRTTMPKEAELPVFETDSRVYRVVKCSLVFGFLRRQKLCEEVPELAGWVLGLASLSSTCGVYPATP